MRSVHHCRLLQNAHSLNHSSSAQEDVCKEKKKGLQALQPCPLIPWQAELEEDEVGDVVSPGVKCIHHKWRPGSPGISCSLSCEASDHTSVLLLALHLRAHRSC